MKKQFLSRIIFAFTLLLITSGGTLAKNIFRTPGELIEIAQREISEVIEIPADCEISVEPLYNGRKVVFKMEVPENFWTMTPYPEVHFAKTQDKAVVRIWSTLRADEHSPNPQAISQWFLHKAPEKDPEMCLALMKHWFDANRNRGRVVNFEYDRYAYAHVQAGLEDEWFSTLEREREQATAPEAVYEIHKQLAKVYLDRDQPEKAIENWQIAQAAMLPQTNSYMTTRYALPYIEIAKIYIQMEDNASAVDNLEQVLTTHYGKKTPIEVTNLLGSLYEEQAEFDKARQLYMPILAEDYGKNASNQIFVKRAQDSIREKLRLLDLKEEQFARDLLLPAKPGITSVESWEGTFEIQPQPIAIDIEGKPKLHLWLYSLEKNSKGTCIGFSRENGELLFQPEPNSKGVQPLYTGYTVLFKDSDRVEIILMYDIQGNGGQKWVEAYNFDGQEIRLVSQSRNSGKHNFTWKNEYVPPPSKELDKSPERNL